MARIDSSASVNDVQRPASAVAVLPTSMRSRADAATPRRGRSFLRALSRSPKGLSGFFIVAVVLATAFLAPLLAPADPNAQNLVSRLRPPIGLAGSTQGHLLGTDPLGRDLLSRVMYGARVSLVVALSSVFLSTLLGVTLGLISGYFGGLSDQVIMRLVEVQLSFPYLLVAVTVLSVVSPGIFIVVIVLAMAGWPTVCRMVRGEILALLQREFILAARAIGAPSLWIIFRHLLPNAMSVIHVVATIQAAQFILAEATLSFLGLGIPPAIPTWGGIINEGRTYIWQAWWITTFPGLAVVFSVSGLGLFGDWLRDYLDPTLRT